MGERIAGMRDTRRGRNDLVLTLTHTVPQCRDGESFDRALGCVQEVYVQSVDAAFVLDEYPGQVVPRQQPLRFDGKLAPGSRAQLAQSFRERNRESHRFAGDDLEGLLAVSAKEFQQKREAMPTAGVVRFSAPGYSTVGYALVYGSYICGGLCGYGWLFLLKQEESAWRVVASEGLWIS